MQQIQNNEVKQKDWMISTAQSRGQFRNIKFTTLCSENVDSFVKKDSLMQSFLQLVLMIDSQVTMRKIIATKSNLDGRMIASLSHQIPSKLIEVLKELGLNQALIGSTMESLKNSCNHHSGIDRLCKKKQKCGGRIFFSKILLIHPPTMF